MPLRFRCCYQKSNYILDSPFSVVRNEKLQTSWRLELISSVDIQPLNVFVSIKHITVVPSVNREKFNFCEER